MHSRLQILARAIVLSIIALHSPASSPASVTISIFAGRLQKRDGSPLAPGTLIQLVNLGPNGVFDSVNIGDGNVSGPALWVSGDDSLLNVPFFAANGAAGDYLTTAAFDLRHSLSTESTTGVMSRVFDLTVPAGINLGIRWWPQIQATDYATFAFPSFSDPAWSYDYGEFTRQSTPLHNGDVWRTPSDGSTVTFDGLATAEIGGLDSSAAGRAEAGRISNIPLPEPASAGLLVLGGLFAASIRRRMERT